MSTRLQILREQADLHDLVAMVMRHNDGAAARLFVRANRPGPGGMIVPLDACTQEHTQRKAEIREAAAKDVQSAATTETAPAEGAPALPFRPGDTVRCTENVGVCLLTVGALYAVAHVTAAYTILGKFPGVRFSSWRFEKADVPACPTPT